MTDDAQKEQVAKPKAIGAIALAPKAKKGGRQTINIHIGKIVHNVPGRYRRNNDNAAPDDHVAMP